MNITDTLPTKADIAKLIKSLLPKEGYVLQRYGEPFGETVYATETEADEALEASDEADETAPVFQSVTIGWTPEKGSWSYQTGDNSFSGGAYSHPLWAVVDISHDSDPEAVAEDVLEQLAEQMA